VKCETWVENGNHWAQVDREVTLAEKRAATRELNRPCNGASSAKRVNRQKN